MHALLRVGRTVGVDALETVVASDHAAHVLVGGADDGASRMSTSGSADEDEDAIPLFAVRGAVVVLGMGADGGRSRTQRRAPLF